MKSIFEDYGCCYFCYYYVSNDCYILLGSSSGTLSSGEVGISVDLRYLYFSGIGLNLVKSGVVV
jgi:hypothetical protein